MVRRSPDGSRLASKYISGHGNTIGGAAITNDDAFKDKLYSIMKDLGGCPSPFDSWLIHLGLKTLALRMERHCASAQKVAEYLQSHSKVKRVIYPGLKNHPQHELASRQMSGFSGVIAFEVVGGYAAAQRIMNGIDIFTLAVSLGTVDSLIQHPATMTHSSVEAATREKLGISDGLLRISVGLEDVDDLIAALDRVL